MGSFVEILENKCEGMIPIRGLAGDFYEYDEDNYCIREEEPAKSTRWEIRFRSKL
jgi:ribonuclease R